MCEVGNKIVPLPNSTEWQHDECPPFFVLPGKPATCPECGFTIVNRVGKDGMIREKIKLKKVPQFVIDLNNALLFISRCQKSIFHSSRA